MTITEEAVATTDSDDNLLNKADALMRRHRAFIAGQAATAEAAQPADASGDDVPVLTEVVPGDGVTLPRGDVLDVSGGAGHAILGGHGVSPAPTFTAALDDAAVDALLRERLAAALPQQRETLRRELATWLDEQLPQLVMRVLDGVTDQLVAQVNTQARMALLPRLQAVLEPEATIAAAAPEATSQTSSPPPG